MGYVENPQNLQWQYQNNNYQSQKKYLNNKKGNTKWCEHHKVISHNTSKCRAKTSTSNKGKARVNIVKTNKQEDI